MNDLIRQYNAFIKLYFSNPFPENLTDDEWVENVKQIQWLADRGLLGIKRQLPTE